MKEQRTLNIIAIALIIGALLVLFCFTAFFKSEKIDLAEMAKVSSQIDALTKEKMTLEIQLDELESKYSESIRVISTEQFLITDASTKIYTDVFPLFKSLNAVISVSPADFNYGSRRLGAKRISEMLESGWSCCISYKGGDLAEQLENMHRVVETNGLEMPKSIYFADGAYDTEFDEVLASYGITTAIHSSGEDFPPLVTYFGEGEIWHIGITPWNGNDIESTIESLVTDGANAVFEINFDEESDAVFDAVGFHEMLSYISDYRTEGLLEITDFGTAREYRRESERLMAEYETDFVLRRDEYRKQIDNINTRIEELCSEY